MRADRSLSGRLVCSSCGTPFGEGRRSKYKTGIFNNFFFNNNKYLIFVFLFIIAFILVVI